jgi:catechol 2,3-dioxygenase-like lactoylglutathione lyase family enzyme
MIKTRGVNHVALRISDVSRASDFYGKLLGLEVVPFPVVDRDKTMKFREAIVSSKGYPCQPAGSGSPRATHSFI